MQSFEHCTAYVTHNDCFEFWKITWRFCISAKVIVKKHVIELMLVLSVSQTLLPSQYWYYMLELGFYISSLQCGIWCQAQSESAFITLRMQCVCGVVCVCVLWVSLWVVWCVLRECLWVSLWVACVSVSECVRARACLWVSLWVWSVSVCRWVSEWLWVRACLWVSVCVRVHVCEWVCECVCCECVSVSEWVLVCVSVSVCVCACGCVRV